VQRSLEAGDNPVGVTVLYTVSKMDAGPIIAQKEETIEDVNSDDATATNVLPWLFDIGTNLLIEKMPDILSGEMTFDTAQPQDEESVVQAAMIDSSEAEMKPWKETAATLHNRLRGFSMWPGAFIYLEVGEGSAPVKYKILQTRLLDETAEDGPTDVIERGPSKKDGLRLVCFDRSILEINRLQPATKKPIDALSFINGLQGRTVRYVKELPVEA
jgi:methionyl-tRNA formyltransferase